MPYPALITQRNVFDADGSTSAFYWGGGPGTLSAQGDQGGGTVSVQVYLRTEASESGDASGGTYATLTDALSSEAASVSGLSGESEMKSVAFSAPPCYMKLTLAGSSSPDFVAVVSRDIVRTQ